MYCKIKYSRHYEQTLFICTIFFENVESIIFPIAFIAGAQNGMYLKFDGILLRTSHLTGTLTDAGFEVGHLLRKKRQDRTKMGLYMMTIGCFIIGGMIGLGISVQSLKIGLRVAGTLYCMYGIFVVTYSSYSN